VVIKHGLSFFLANKGLGTQYLSFEAGRMMLGLLMARSLESCGAISFDSHMNQNGMRAEMTKSVEGLGKMWRSVAWAAPSVAASHYHVRAWYEILMIT